MRNISIILVLITIAVLNINSYGELDRSVIENSKLIMIEQGKVAYFFAKSINWGILMHIAELIFIVEISKRNLTY